MPTTGITSCEYWSSHFNLLLGAHLSVKQVHFLVSVPLLLKKFHLLPLHFECTFASSYPGCSFWGMSRGKGDDKETFEADIEWNMSLIDTVYDATVQKTNLTKAQDRSNNIWNFYQTFQKHLKMLAVMLAYQYVLLVINGQQLLLNTLVTNKRWSLRILFSSRLCINNLFYGERQLKKINLFNKDWKWHLVSMYISAVIWLSSNALCSSIVWTHLSKWDFLDLHIGSHLDDFFQ